MQRVQNRVKNQAFRKKCREFYLPSKASLAQNYYNPDHFFRLGFNSIKQNWDREKQPSNKKTDYR